MNALNSLERFKKLKKLKWIKWIKSTGRALGVPRLSPFSTLYFLESIFCCSAETFDALDLIHINPQFRFFSAFLKARW